MGDWGPGDSGYPWTESYKIVRFVPKEGGPMDGGWGLGDSGYPWANSDFYKIRR